MILFMLRTLTILPTIIYHSTFAMNWIIFYEVKSQNNNLLINERVGL